MLLEAQLPGAQYTCTTLAEVNDEQIAAACCRLLKKAEQNGKFITKAYP